MTAVKPEKKTPVKPVKKTPLIDHMAEAMDKLDKPVVEDELPAKLNVVHKTTGEKFEVSRAYYLNNRRCLDIA